MSEEKREPSKLEKRYKRLRWAQYILFWLSIATAVLPAAIVAYKVGRTFKRAEEGWSLTGFAVIIIGIGAVLIVGGLLNRFHDKIPWAFKAAIGSGILTLLLWSLQSIVEEAFYISIALAIGCTVALIMGSISDLCDAQADSIEQEYNRRQG